MSNEEESKELKSSPRYQTPFTPFLSKQSTLDLAEIYQTLKICKAEHILYHHSKNTFINYNNDQTYLQLEKSLQNSRELLDHARGLYFSASERGEDEETLEYLKNDVNDVQDKIRDLEKSIKEQKSSLNIKGFSENTLKEINEELMTRLDTSQKNAFIESKIANASPSSLSISPQEHLELRTEYERAIIEALGQTQDLVIKGRENPQESSVKRRASMTDEVFFRKPVINILIDPGIADSKKESILRGLTRGGYLQNAAIQIKEVLLKNPVFQKLVEHAAEKARDVRNEDHQRG